MAEEAAKWSREQRAAQEVLMENIKSGGNGLTVRTVIGAQKKTVYIIQNGKADVEIILYIYVLLFYIYFNEDLVCRIGFTNCIALATIFI